MVITDLKLPGLDGLEVVKQLHTAKPKLPIILMTAHGTTDTATAQVVVTTDTRQTIYVSTSGNDNNSGATPSSAAVRISTTPGMPAASPTWIAPIVPCAASERTNTACSLPGSARSARSVCSTREGR